MRATQDDIPQARADVERELEALDTTLGNGRRFLLGDHLTGADIATASLLSPIARPRQHPVYGTAAPSDPEQQIINTYRDRPCVRWALRLYEDFR
jgi:glutathione S-transferase